MTTPSRYPKAVWRPLPEAETQPSIVPTQLILHTIVGSAEGAFRYFRDSTSLESHLIVTNAGAVWQLIPFTRSADANYLANRRKDGTGAISVETEDEEPRRPVGQTPWTPEQVDALVEFLTWACKEYGIPARLCSTPTDHGIGWHSMWGSPSQWTNVRGKTCPGAARIAQIPGIVARVAAAVTGPAPQTVCPAPVVAPAKPSAPVTPAAPAAGRHVVASGETMQTIAGRHGLTLTQLRALNPHVMNPNVIRVGQVLNVPGGKTAPVTAPGVTPEQERIKDLQHVLGVRLTGTWDAETVAACGKHLVGWSTAVFERSGKTAAAQLRNDRNVVKWIQRQANRRWNTNVAVDGLPGPALNHIIVVLVGQADAICGPKGFRELAR